MTDRNGTFAALLHRKLAAAGKTPSDLAECLDLSLAWVSGLLDGSVPPPRPSGSDIYDRMTRCVRAARKELATAAAAEREGEPVGSPAPKVAAALLALCDDTTAATLTEKCHRALLAEILQRLLELMQAPVARSLADAIGIRAGARRRGLDYAQQREAVLRFLDATAGSVTPGQVAEFIVPRLARWDVDLETGVLRLVLHGQEADDRHRRRPPTRRVV